MKLLARTLMLCAITSFSLNLPALSQEQVGGISSDQPGGEQALGEMLTEGDLLAILPGEALSAVPPGAMPGADEAIGAEGPGGPEHGPGEHGPGEHGHWKHHGPLSGANALTDEQFEKLYALRVTYLNTVGPKMPELGRLHRELKDALLASDIDTTKVNSITSRLTTLRNDIATAKTNRLVASAQVLTADQRKALHSTMIRHEALQGLPGHDGHHGHHFGHH